MDRKNIAVLYDKDTLKVMERAEDAYVRGSNRLEEIRNYAKTAGIKRIGIAHCVSMPKEAAAVRQFLAEDFDVFSVDCKCGKFSKLEMLGRDGIGVMCNPAGQADFLKDNATELNISMGLCVGHDMIFNQKSNVAVTTLVVKDRVNNHHVIEGTRALIK